MIKTINLTKMTGKKWKPTEEVSQANIREMCFKGESTEYNYRLFKKTKQEFDLFEKIQSLTK